MLQQILAFVQRINLLLAQILQTVLDISGAQNDANILLRNLGIQAAGAALEHNAFQIETVATGAFNGTKAANTKLDALATAVAALGGGGPVTLPTIPPAGYGTPTSGDIGNAVWTYGDGLGGYTALAVLLWSGLAARHLTDASFDAPFGDYWKPHSFDINNLAVVGVAFPIFLPLDILPGETFLANITRQNPSPAIAQQFTPGGQVSIDMHTTDSVIQWVTTFDEAEFLEYRDGSTALVPVFRAPVWPGLANVVMGSAVAISPQFSITGPMHGVIVSITGVPTKTGFYPFDGLLSYRNIGGLTFTDDSGDAELPQTLGFQSAVYLCRAMAEASAVHIRSIGGVVGTATAFTIVS